MNCPVCHSKNTKPCLTLENSPIYQHPVPDPTIIPPPYTVDLYYQRCSDCSHVYQLGDNQRILENIYSHHYYTPPPSNIGTTFRDDFLHFINQLTLTTQITSSILEVGSSSGEMLAALKNMFSVNNAVGFEPNIDAANEARDKGLNIYTEFFTVNAIESFNKTFDLIYSRHVIEHIFDFEDFFKATNLISSNKTQLIIETPSLDWAIENNSTIAFHIEHIHVFSEFSLVKLAKLYGWHKKASTATSAGNLITAFTKYSNVAEQPSLPNNMADMQKNNETIFKYINTITKQKKTILWGAGTCGISLISSAKIKPVNIVDGNADKAGKFYCGFDKAVEFAPTVIKKLVKNNQDRDMLIIISSSFYQEIKANLHELGWRGEIYIPEIF
ncbi:class I SAM-dependent methyltransferase [Colwellia sp. E150_009]